MRCFVVNRFQNFLVVALNFNLDKEYIDDEGNQRTPAPYQARDDDNNIRTPAPYQRYDDQDPPQPVPDKPPIPNS